MEVGSMVLKHGSDNNA